jgi:E3 ubiquitin-protein ligase RNF19A
MNGKSSTMSCPDRMCLKDISIKFLTKHLMSPNIYDKYLKFNKRNEVSRNPNLKWCPTPDCEGYLEKPPLED